MIIGYARVSTDGQTLDAQQSALAAAGAEKVFAEKVSGAVTDRKALGRAIATLGAGDVLVVTAAGSARAINQGPPQRPRCGGEGWRGFQIAG
jgi:Resolvase, N terminal domain